jgi:hypothetical protein
MVYVSVLSSMGNKRIDTKTRILINILYCKKVNADKANGKYDQYIGCGDDRDPSFRMVL